MLKENLKDLTSVSHTNRDMLHLQRKHQERHWQPVKQTSYKSECSTISLHTNMRQSWARAKTVLILTCVTFVESQNKLTLEVLLGPLVLRFSPLLEFFLKSSQELSGESLDTSEDDVSWKTQGRAVLFKSSSDLWTESRVSSNAGVRAQTFLKAAAEADKKHDAHQSFLC